LVIVLIGVMYLHTGSVFANATASTDGLAAPSLWVTPLVLDFGPVGVDDTGDTLIVTIHNTGDATLTNFAGGGVAAPVSAAQNCASGVPPGGTCQYFFNFSPTEVGNFTATSNSGTNAGPITIELRGEGVGPGLYVNPLSLDFGSVYYGATSGQQVVTIHNTGLSTLTNFAGGGVAAPFSAAQNCASGVLPGESCQYFFTFSPDTSGFFTATSTSGTNAGSFSIDLQGTGRTLFFGSGQRVTPRSLNFGPVGVGLSSSTLTVDVTNQSPFATISNFAGGGVNPPFSASQNCAPDLPPGDTCQFFYTFNPTNSGVFTTTSQVSNSTGSFSIALRGEGVGAGLSVSPLVLDFGPVAVGDSGTVQTVTVKNTGMATLTGFAGGGVVTPFSATQNCAGGVQPGGTCEFFYYFNPTEAGQFMTTSNVGSNAGSFSILLMGGVDFPVLDQTFIPAQIQPGGTSTIQYTINNPNQGGTLFEVGFSNTFPSGMRVAAPLTFNLSPECGSPTFSPIVNATSIAFTDATVLGGDDCVISLNVTADDIGLYTNTTGPITSASGTGDASSATLTVGARLYLPVVLR